MTTPDSGSVRAGNTDREKVVAHLNTAFAEGRLDVGELDERVSAAYRAKTLGELVPLTADLPAIYQNAPKSPARLPADVPDRQVEHAGPSNAVRWAPVTGALGLFLINVVIWGAVSLGSGNLVYFWPVWTAIPFVLALIGMVASSGDRRDRRRR
jgi:hypothetical protein